MPMTTESVDVRLAGAQLSRLLQRVEAGEEFVISRSGKPVARLVPYIPPNRPRVFGALKGQIRIRPGFDELDDEFTGEFASSIARSIDP